MDLKPFKRLGILAATVATALVLIGCNGSAGQSGAAGINGTNGTNGTNGVNGTNGTNGTGPLVNVADMTPAEWGALSLTGKVTSVDLTQGTPKVYFQVTDVGGTPVTGLGWTTKSATAVMPSYANFGFTLAKLVPSYDLNGKVTTSQWVNYIVTSVPSLNADGTPKAAAPGKPSTDSTGLLTEPTPGNYVYTFYRDIKSTTLPNGVQTVVNGFTYSGNNIKADLGNIAYDATLTHRIAIQVGGAARGTGTNTPDTLNGATAVNILNPANITYDFTIGANSLSKDLTPTDLGRTINNTVACNNCHTRLVVHGGNRVNPDYCSVCHTDQRKYGSAEATHVAGGFSGSTTKINGLAAGNFPAFIHRLHMGEGLSLTGYNYANILFNETRYPQDIRNCQTCHTNQPASAVIDAPPVAPKTPQGDNWMTQPSRLACGACHDNVDFTSTHGTGVPATSTTDDHLCAFCHIPADIATYHTPVWTPLQAGSNLVPAHGGMQSFSYQATNTANLPKATTLPNGTVTKGAHSISWNLISAKVTAGVPSLTFSILMDGTAIHLNAQPASVPAATTAIDMFPASAPFVNNLFGAATNAPDFILIAGLPQDGITPADYNYRLTPSLKSIWSGAAAPTITWKDNGNSTYTITAVGYVLPAGTGVVSMGIGLGMLTQTDLGQPNPSALISSFNQPVPPAVNSTPFSAMDMTYNTNGYTAAPTGGLIVPSRAALLNVAGAGLGSIPALSRRNIIKTNACNICHSTLGAFTAIDAPANFHGVGIGDSNDGNSCVVCHNPSGVDATGFSYNTKPWVHALHAGGMRDTPFTAHSASGTDFWNIGYPGMLNNCEACHTPGSYDFSSATNAAQVPYMLWDSASKGAVSLTPAASYPLSVTSSGKTTNYSVPQSVSQAAAAGVKWVAPVLPVAAVVGTPGTGYYAPFVSNTLAYGPNASWSWTAPVAPATVGTWTYAPATVSQLTATNTTAPVTNLTGTAVVSPITSACSACHDTPQAIAHFKGMGGTFYGDRYAASGNKLGTPIASGANYAWPTGNLVNTEQCLICHGPGTVGDIKTVHMNF